MQFSKSFFQSTKVLRKILIYPALLMVYSEPPTGHFRPKSHKQIGFELF